MKKISLGLLAICLSFRAVYAQQDPKAAATLDAVSKNTNKLNPLRQNLPIHWKVPPLESMKPLKEKL